MMQTKSKLTGAADLGRAAAAAVADDGHDPRAEAGAPLLAAAAHRTKRRVRLAAVVALLVVDVAAHAGALEHAAAHRSQLPTGDGKRRRWVAQWHLRRTGVDAVTSCILYLYTCTVYGVGYEQQKVDKEWWVAVEFHSLCTKHWFLIQQCFNQTWHPKILLRKMIDKLNTTIE